jgi:hypothetical protein
MRLTPQPAPTRLLIFSGLTSCRTVPDNVRQVAGRGELGHEDVLDLGTRIALTQQESFALQVGPVDNVVRG